jgi:uncharacterized glyoxalase superfamily protein PhnB
MTPSFTVSDAARSISWYRDVLGFHVKEEWRDNDEIQGALLQAGSAFLMIKQADFADRRDRPKSAGFRIHCTTRQNLDGLAAEIRSRGGMLASEPADQPWGTRDFGVIDPDGYHLTFSSNKG